MNFYLLWQVVATVTFLILVVHGARSLPSAIRDAVAAKREADRAVAALKAARAEMLRKFGV